jgi:serine O-acetyltransferase
VVPEYVRINPIRFEMILVTFNELKEFIRSDLYRYEGQISRSLFLRNTRRNPGFQYTLWMRICSYFFHRKKGLLYKGAFFIARRFLTRYRYKLGIDIPYSTVLGSGLYIGHFGCIFINPDAVIGNNLNISQGVTIAQSSRGTRIGCPTIGDNVYIGPGAKIVGAVRIGNNVAIGANCVVTKDIPDNAVVVGIPGKVISFKGSEGYILNAYEVFDRMVGAK